MDEVLNGHGDIVKGDEGAPRCADARIVHLAGCDARDFKGNDEDRDTCCTRAASSDCCCDVVGPDAIGDPFLGAVDNVVVAFSDGRCFDVRNIRSSYRE